MSSRSQPTARLSPRRSGRSASVARRYSHKIPFIVKLNHNDFLHYPNTYDQVMFGSVRQAFDLGAIAVGATIYFGSPESDRQLHEVSVAFAEAHRLGMFTVLWCYLRNPAFKTARGRLPPVGRPHRPGEPHGSDDRGGPNKAEAAREQRRVHVALNFGKTDPLVYDQLTTDNPIDLTRWQVVNCYAGRIGLINSGGESKGSHDLAQAVRTAVINKRAGGTGLIVGPQGVPAADGRRRRADPRGPGRLLGQERDHRLTGSGGRSPPFESGLAKS